MWSLHYKCINKYQYDWLNGFWDCNQYCDENTSMTFQVVPLIWAEIPAAPVHQYQDVSCCNIWLLYVSYYIELWIYLHRCRCFQLYPEIPLQCLKALAEVQRGQVGSGVMLICQCNWQQYLWELSIALWLLYFADIQFAIVRL